MSWLSAIRERFSLDHSICPLCGRVLPAKPGGIAICAFIHKQANGSPGISAVTAKYDKGIAEGTLALPTLYTLTEVLEDIHPEIWGGLLD